MSPGDCEYAKQIAYNGGTVLVSKCKWEKEDLENLKRFPHIYCMSGESIQGPLESSTACSWFDGVRLAGTLWALPRTFFQGVYQALKPGGSFVLEWVDLSNVRDSKSDNLWSTCDRICKKYAETQGLFYTQRGSEKVIQSEIRDAGLCEATRTWTSLKGEQAQLLCNTRVFYSALRSKFSREQAELFLLGLRDSLRETGVVL